jgi:hypothetical protein
LRSTPGTKLPPDPDAKPDDAGRMPVDRWKEKPLYDVFESDGRYVGQVELPERFEPSYMNGNMLWGRLRDEDGTEYAAKYRIEPNAGRT